MKKEGNEAIIAGMEYGIYILQGNDLYDAVTAANLKESEKWDRKNAHVVVFCDNMVIQIEGDEGKELPFSYETMLNGKKTFDAFEAIHVYDEEALELTRELAGSRCAVASYAINKGDGWFVPSAGHLMAIQHYRSEINNIIKVYTEDSVIINDWYWSCNQFSAANAWYIYMPGGCILNYGNKTLTNRVRAISAIDLNTLTLHLSNTEEAE